MEISESMRILTPLVSLCKLIVAGRDGTAVGLQFDEENMFAPMILFKEQDGAFITQAAEDLMVPVVDNSLLAESLYSRGKSGEAIPDSCYREVAALLARVSNKGHQKRLPYFRKNLRSVNLRLSRPLSVEMGKALFLFIREDQTGGNIMGKYLRKIRLMLRELLGFTIPQIKISSNPGLKRDEYRILFKGVEAGRGRINLDWYPAEEMESGEIPVPKAALPGFCGGEPLKKAVDAAAGVVGRHLEELVFHRAPDLLGRDEVQALLDKAEELYPVVTGEVKAALSLGCIREILQILVAEQVSISNIVIILETLADWGNFGPASNETMVQQIRQALRKQICLQYADDSQTLRVLTLDAKLDERFSDPALVQELNTDHWDYCIKLLSPGIAKMEARGLHPVILCSPPARSWVKEVTRKKFPGLAVLSFMEIPPDIKVESLGEIPAKGRIERWP
ncbi:MAG: FHIPEP family type III secretion protein [Treponema sp.]|nr:FHIPEP family type III secretion protein [Treponema sp.]